MDASFCIFQLPFLCYQHFTSLLQHVVTDKTQTRSRKSGRRCESSSDFISCDSSLTHSSSTVPSQAPAFLRDSALSVSWPVMFLPPVGLSRSFLLVFLTTSPLQGTLLSQGWHFWPPYLKPYPPHLAKSPSQLYYFLRSALHPGTHSLSIPPIFVLFCLHPAW